MKNQTSQSRASQFRIGLLVDSACTSKYIFDLVVWAQKCSDVVSISHLIILSSDRHNTQVKSPIIRLISGIRRRGFGGTCARILFKFILVLEHIMLKRHERHRDHFQRFDLSTLVENKVLIYPIVSKSGFVYRFSTEDVQRVNNLRMDVLIRCGSNILRGDILNAARFGVISFHHADNRINRGGPAGFWEVYLKQDTTGFTIQRLTEELDGGDVLMRGHFQTRAYYLLNEANLFERSNHYLKLLLLKIAADDTIPAILPSVPYSNTLFRSPNTRQATLYLTKRFKSILEKKIRRLVDTDFRWSVGFVHSDWRRAVLWRAKRLKNPPSHFLADPFVISRDNRTYCFVEDFDLRSQKGSIAVYELTEDGGRRLGVALEELFHLSFPYIFEFQGEVLMCPETSANRDIRIYRCIKFPLHWELYDILMEDVCAADTMLFEKDGLWWMFTNLDPIEAGDYCTEMSIFFTKHLFDRQWKSHPLNPVIVDSSRARNGGLLQDGQTHFRVSQRQGFDFYGKSSSINKISELTKTTYSEELVCSITPDFSDNVVGTHHFHSNGEFTVFDLVSSSG